MQKVNTVKSEQILTFRAETFGLWGRFISRLLVAWLIISFGGTWFVAFIVGVLGLPILWIALPVIFVVVTMVMFREFPARWKKNTIHFDFDRQSLIIENDKQSAVSSGVLDDTGQHFAFSEIDAYSTIQYDSSIFSAYYLVSIFVKGSQVRLISLKNADDYTKLVSLLQHQLKLRMK